MTENTTPPTARPYRWVLLGALWFGYLSFGLNTSSLAPLITPICNELNLSRSEMGLILGAWAMVFIGAAIPAGTIIDRFGIRRGLAGGMLLVALSGLARAFAFDGVTLFVAVGIFGLGGPLMSVGAPKLIAQWFDAKERGTAVGLYMTGPFLGSALAISSANSVWMPLFDDSWRLTLGVFAAVAVVAAITWMAVSYDAGVPTRNAGAGPKGPTGLKASLALLEVPVVRIILAMALAAFMFTHAMNSWLPEILRARDLDAATAGYYASIPTLIGILSSLIIPGWAKPERRVYVLTALYSCLAIATLTITFTSGTGLIAGLVLLGVARVIGPMAVLILMEAPKVGARNMGAATGLYFTVGEIGGVMGPTMIGIMADLTGGFTVGVLVLSGLAVFLIGMTFVLRRALVHARTGAAL
jgi:MFS transporter, CP family, cyanate transporter